MARSVILGNGGLTVGLDENGQVHDFYYPYVGLENLTTARSKAHQVGVWVDGQFSWISDSEWKKEVTFNNNALISNITMSNERLKIGLFFEDFVDGKHNVFARQVTVKNNTDREREVRIFFHQYFQISSEGRGDTALYVPEGHYVLDYKGRCSVLAYAQTASGKPFDQYAVGNANIEGKEGTYRDAEDGELSMSAVEHASVDSTIRLTLNIPSNSSDKAQYWLAISDSQHNLLSLHERMKGDGFMTRFEATVRHWHDWFSDVNDKLLSLPIEHEMAVRKSLMTIKAHVDKHGGIIASCDSSIYNYGRDYYSYVWPRDGAFVIWPLMKLGFFSEAKNFFKFCKKIMHEDGYMMHKYQPDQAIGSTWHPLVHNRHKEYAIQEDETAILIVMLSEYQKYSNDTSFIDSMYEGFIVPAAEFMYGYIDKETGLPHASYDLWEEKFLTTTYTTACVYRALIEASKFAKDRSDDDRANRWLSRAESVKNNSDGLFDTDKGYYIKGALYEDGYKDSVLDVSSLYGVYAFRMFDDEEKVHSTVRSIESIMLDNSPSGGTPRYENDGYFRSDPAYKGNPWFVTTLWIAQYYAAHGQTDKAQRYLSWALNRRTESGLLSEQINPSDNNVVGVTPLIWSHAELINTILMVN